MFLKDQPFKSEDQGTILRNGSPTGNGLDLVGLSFFMTGNYDGFYDLCEAVKTALNMVIRDPVASCVILIARVLRHLSFYFRHHGCKNFCSSCFLY